MTFLKDFQQKDGQTKSDWLFWMLVILQTLLFVWWYPKFITIHDEASYLGLAYSFTHGTIFPDQVGLDYLSGAAQMGQHLVVKYPPGMALALYPTILFASHWGMGCLFIVNWLAFLAAAACFNRIIRYFNIRPIWNLLFLCFPVFVLYSRTIMSDLIGMSALLYAFDRLLAVKLNKLEVKKHSLYSTRHPHSFMGFALGLSACFRYTHLIMLPVFLFWLWKDKLLTKKGLAGFALGAAIPLSALGAYHWFAYGSLMPDGYIVHDNVAAAFSLSYLKAHLPYYVMSLCLLYPLMLPGLLLKGKNTPRGLIATTSGIFLLLYGSYYFIQTGGENFVAQMITASRFLMPVQAFLLVHYAGVLDSLWDHITHWLQQRKLSEKNIRQLSVVLTGVMVVTASGSSWMVHKKHAERSELYQKISQTIYENTTPNSMMIVNSAVLRFLNPFESPRHVKGLMYLSKADWAQLPITRKAVDHFSRQYPDAPIYLVEFDQIHTLPEMKAMMQSFREKYAPLQGIYKKTLPPFRIRIDALSVEPKTKARN